MEVSDSEGYRRSEEHIIRKSRRGHGISRVAECFPGVHPAVMRKVELINDNHGYISEEISKQSVEGVARFLLASCRKRREEKDTLRKNC